MTKQAEYKQYAADCRRAVNLAGSQSVKALLLAMAERWNELAERVEREAERDARFAKLGESLLEKSGGPLSPTEAANLLGVSPQAVEKQIKSGSALGMMRGRELVLPRAQFVEREGRFEIRPGIPEVVNLFSVAGGWSALQFLVETDPNLAEAPIQALAEGRVGEVISAAKAYLDADED